MKKEQHKKASEFPLISRQTLQVIIEAARLPKKSQNLPLRATKARVLAMKLRRHQASRKISAAPATNAGDTWKNVKEFLESAVLQDDFDTLDQFCEGWLQLKWGAKAQKLDCEVLAFNGGPPPSQEIMIVSHTFPPGVRQSLEIAGAILRLQNDLKRPPYPTEIVEWCDSLKRGLARFPVCEADVSKFLKRWNLKGALPDKRKNP